MILKQLNLTYFRNFEKESFEVSPALTIILGENSKGKTNLLESIYFSAVGKGFRESNELELINWKSKESRVESHWLNSENAERLEIYLLRQEQRAIKTFFINKTRKGSFSYKKQSGKAVLFSPEQIEIISGSPNKRREYFNDLISLLDGEYKKRLQNYEHSLRKRNKILENYLNLEKLKEELIFWNSYLEEQAEYIQEKRKEYCEVLNLNKKIDSKEFRIEYLENPVTEARFEERFDLESRMRKTSIGPQKDDFKIFLTEEVSEDVHLYGSRSEQRLAIFWLKLNEIKHIEEITKIKPILLLDDIFSELDGKNRKLVMTLINEYQTVLTTTDKELIKIADKKSKLINL